MSDRITTDAVREARRSAAALLGKLPDDVWREHEGAVENAIAQLAEECAAERATERAACVAYLRRRAMSTVGASAALSNNADRIERGEHLDEEA